MINYLTIELANRVLISPKISNGGFGYDLGAFPVKVVKSNLVVTILVFFFLLQNNTIS